MADMGFFRTHDITQDAQALNAIGTEMRRLWAEGVAGSAVIVAATDTGTRLAGNVVLDLDLEVTVADAVPYPSRLRMPIAGDDVRPYAAGRRYAVKVDPQDPNKLTFSA